MPLALAIGACACTGAPIPFDVVVRGGQVFDGISAVPLRVDLGIAGDRIVAMGHLGSAAASRHLDANGLVVAPGFIDVGMRPATAFLADVTSEHQLRQGITTELVSAASPDLAESFSRFLRRGHTINAGALIAMPPDGGNTQQAAIARGALGASVEASGFSQPERLNTLARNLAAQQGVFAVRVPSAPDAAVAAARSAIQLARETGVGVVLYPPFTADIRTLSELIALIVDARNHGLIVHTTLTPGGNEAAAAYWWRDSGASVASRPDRTVEDAGSAAQSRADRAFSYVLARYVQEEPVLTVGQAIARMTSVAAGQFHLPSRGVLRVGAYADVVIFDPASPGSGVRAVVVNGVPVLEDGALTGARPGQFIGNPSRPRSEAAH